MNEIEKCREELDLCDDQIFELLLKRNAIVEELMVYKEARQIPIFQPEQEERKNKKWQAKLEGKKHPEEIMGIMNRIIRTSKRIQARKLFSHNIVLIGFMGAGKSTISEFLSTMFAMKIVEMDQVIAEREEMSIPDIFATYGEEYFRNLETKLLIELQEEKNTIISCGGGVAMRKENVVEMKKNGKVVLLTAQPETILERVKDSDERPLLNGNKNIEFIRELIGKRREKYEEAADVILHTDNKSIMAICEELIEKLTE